jgi:S-adenosylmethionine:tRNA ribosyltransferase-isomerase
MKKNLFYYELPEKFIAQEPLEKRDNSKILLLDRRSGRIKHDFFYNLVNYVFEGDVFVLNDSKVVKCRLIGYKEKTNAEIECFVLNRIDDYNAEVLLKPSKRLTENTKVFIGEFYFEVTKKQLYGKATVRFNTKIVEVIEKSGMVPLPPYIRNKHIDIERYQTIYADRGYSAAAPTAGLHFSEEIIEKLKKCGVIFARVTLNIGLDTFRPVVEDEIEEHVIHSESYFIEETEAAKITEAKKRKARIVAVGTTGMRVIESAFKENGEVEKFSGSTSLYIYPGYRFKICDALITNFHLPYSTLLIMVSAFSGREIILEAYEEAKLNNYRFFSFGDCMFIY